MCKNTCCFFGHRTINETDELRLRLKEIVEKLITDETVDTFLFGSKSRFNSLCLELVTEFKEKYPHIKRVYVRAEYPFISDDYREYLFRNYEHTYYPEKLLGATKSVYVKRNREMIDNSRFCIVYYDDNYLPKNRKSGTKIALEYALRNNKTIYRFPIPNTENI